MTIGSKVIAMKKKNMTIQLPMERQQNTNQLGKGSLNPA